MSDFTDGLRRRTLDALDQAAITLNWPKTNRRRSQLIERETNGILWPNEAEELARLDRLAELRASLRDPFDRRDGEDQP